MSSDTEAWLYVIGISDSGNLLRNENEMMLGSNHRISTSVRERKELEYASLRWYKRLLFTWNLLCICGDVAVLGCVPIWEFACRLCHVLFLLVTPSTEARRCMRVLLVSCFSSNCYQWGSYSNIFFLPITLIASLLLQIYENIISETFFFSLEV